MQIHEFALFKFWDSNQVKLLCNLHVANFASFFKVNYTFELGVLVVWFETAKLSKPVIDLDFRLVLLFNFRSGGFKSYKHLQTVSLYRKLVV